MKSECRVIIVSALWTDHVDWLSSIFYNLQCHVFVDDIQCLFFYGDTVEDKSEHYTVSTFISTLQNCDQESTFIVWVACDLVQMNDRTFRGLNSDQFRKVIDCVKKLSLVTLSTNMRNTVDISTMLSVIREQYTPRFPNLGDMIIPKQKLGHFIHGPKPVINLIFRHGSMSRDDPEWCNPAESMMKIFRKEIY